MSANPLLSKIKLLAEPLLASLGLELWGMEFLTGGRAVLRIYIEKTGAAQALSAPLSAVQNSTISAEQGAEQDAGPNCEQAGPEADLPPAQLFGAGIDECAEASRLIGMTLEVEDIIPHAYVLEVSTPGLERSFFTPAQLAAWAGHPVELTLLEPVAAYPERRRFTGVVKGASNTDSGWVFSFVPLGMEELSALGQDPQAEQDAPAIDFSWANIKKARLLYIVPEKPGTPAKKKTGAPKKNKKN